MVLVQAGTDIGTGDLAVLVTTQVETREVTLISGVYGPGPFNGEVFVSPKLKGDLRVISVSGNIAARGHRYPVLFQYRHQYFWEFRIYRHTYVGR